MMFSNPYEVAIVSTLITILGVIIWWWFQRIVKSLDTQCAQQHELALSITRICGTLTAVAQWQEFHERTDASRHEENVRALDQFRQILGGHMIRRTLVDETMEVREAPHAR